MLTLPEVKEYLESLGINLPDFLLVALIEQLEPIKGCLTAYPQSTQVLIQLYLLSLFGMAQGDRYLSSQSSPSGASRSFNYRGFHELWKTRVKLLQSIDPNGCSQSLIPEDPFEEDRANAGLWVSGGGCYERNR